MAARKTSAAADRLAANLASLAPAPASNPYLEADRRNAPMPAEADRPEAYPARIPLKVPEDMKRDLELAKVEDHIEVSARIRAMIALWQQGGKFRAEVDKLAEITGRPKQRRT